MPLLSDSQLFWAAVLLALALVAFTFQRLTSRTDPAISFSQVTDTGATSFLLSGTHLVLFLSALMLGILWWIGVDMAIPTVAVLALVAIHWWIERREIQ